MEGAEELEDDGNGASSTDNNSDVVVRYGCCDASRCGDIGRCGDSSRSGNAGRLLVGGLWLPVD